jgi:hypothetical protein
MGTLPNQGEPEDKHVQPLLCHHLLNRPTPKGPHAFQTGSLVRQVRINHWFVPDNFPLPD